MLFRDRGVAGRSLAAMLDHHAGDGDAVVLALPRGGVPVAYEVAVALGLPLDVFVVRKLRVPGDRDLVMGAIASGGVHIVNDQVIRALGISEDAVAAMAAEEERELAGSERTYRKGLPPLDLAGKKVILIDDGLATGSTMRAAVAAARLHRPDQVVVAVPVASFETVRQLRTEADEVICVETPDPFLALGQWYDDFSRTGDDEVRELLSRAGRGHAVRARGRSRRVRPAAHRG